MVLYNRLTETGLQNQQQKKLFLRDDFRQFSNKNVHIWDHFFTLLFPKDSESLKILDIWLREVGAKRRLNCTSKVNKHPDRRTDGRTDRRTNRLIDWIGPEGWFSENIVQLTWWTNICILIMCTISNLQSVSHKETEKLMPIRMFLLETILLISPKKWVNFFCAAILDNFQTKIFKSETTSFHHFSPRIPNL